jgi:hypothetical protein
MVRAAVERDLRAWEKRKPGVSESTLAAAVLSLADAIDDPGIYPTAKANCTNSLLSMLQEIESLLPPEKLEDSPLDEIRARRAAKLARAEGGVGS